jgi:dihydrofolate reductase
MTDPAPAPKYFKAIAAMAQNRVIGRNNKIPWHLPEDFRWFKKMTTGAITVMGRKTFESLGRPLPHRINLVLTRHPRKLVRDHPGVFGDFKEWRGGRDLKQKNLSQLSFSRLEPAGADTEIRIFNSLDLLHPAEFSTQIFICGGAEIYRQTLPHCSDLYLTIVRQEYEGDAFFPPFEDRFAEVAVIQDKPEFRIVHYRNKAMISSEI